LFLRNKRRAIQFLVLFKGDIFEFFQGLIEGSLFVIDDFAGTVKAFDATDGKDNCAQGDHIVNMGHFSIFHRLGAAADQAAHEGLLVFKFTQDVVVQTFDLVRREGMRIEAMLEGVVVAGRGTMVVGIGVAARSAALA